MKISAETFKNIDYKQIALDHAEKFVVGLVGLFALYILWGTAWFPMSQTPTELTTIVDDADHKIESSEWPDGEKDNFGTDKDLEYRVRKLFSPVDVSGYQFDNPMFWPLYPRQEPIREPEWLTAEDLVVDPARVVVRMRRRRDPNAAAQAKPAEADEETEEDRVARRLFGDRSNVSSRRRTRQRSSGRSELNVEEFGANVRRLQQEQLEDPASVPSDSRMLRFVALRALFPFRRQVEQIQRATDAPTPKAVEHLLQFKDFKVQRQAAVRGPDPWAVEWEDVPVELASRLLKEEIVGQDPDVVKVGVQSQVFTMPLPQRVMGFWGDEASHPRIENFRLSDDEVEQQVAVHKELVERFRTELEKSEANFKKKGRGGFSDAQFDMSQIYRKVVQRKDDWTFSEQLLRDLARSSEGVQGEMLTEAIQAQVNASGRLLLLRYLDFNVVPGRVYRYRVQFTIFNPFFEGRPEALADPSVGEGDTRVTQWSQPSPPVRVATDSEYYLVDVKQNDSSVLPLPKVDVDVFQWHPEAGTLVNAEMGLAAGAAVAAAVTTAVPRPADERYEEESFVIDTKSMLVDAVPAPNIEPKMHPDLSLKSSQTREALGIAKQALFLDRFGELRVIDSVSSAAGHDIAKGLMEDQDDFFGDLRAEEEEEGDDLDREARGRRGQSRNDRRTRKKRLDNPNRK